MPTSTTPATAPAQPPVAGGYPCRGTLAVAGSKFEASSYRRQSLPNDFTPVRLVTCGLVDRTSAAEGTWTYQVVMQATVGLEAVTGALRAPVPSPSRSGDAACALVLISPPWVLLVDADGRAVLPDVPRVPPCNQPRDVGVDALRLSVVAVTRLQQQATPGELATGCQPRWKNEPLLAVEGGRARPVDGTRSATSGPTKVCLYRPGDDPEAGEFTGGTKLSGPQAEQLKQLLVGTPPDGRACRPATDYAVVFMKDWTWLYVELNGCHRLVFDEGSAYAAPPDELARELGRLRLTR